MLLSKTRRWHLTGGGSGDRMRPILEMFWRKSWPKFFMDWIRELKKREEPWVATWFFGLRNWCTLMTFSLEKAARVKNWVLLYYFLMQPSPHRPWFHSFPSIFIIFRLYLPWRHSCPKQPLLPLSSTLIHSSIHCALFLFRSITINSFLPNAMTSLFPNPSPHFSWPFSSV